MVGRVVDKVARLTSETALDPVVHSAGNRSVILWPRRWLVSWRQSAKHHIEAHASSLCRWKS